MHPVACSKTSKFKESSFVDSLDNSLTTRYDPTEVLPSDILFGSLFPVLTLSEMCLCRRVSRKWQRQINNYLGQVRVLDFVPFECVLTTHGLNCVVKHVRNLQVLRLDTCWTSVDEENLCIVAKNCPKLRVLSASRCKGVTNHSLEVLARNCRNVEELDLSSCFQVSDEGILHIAECCKKLAELHVSSCYGVSDKCIEALAQYCPNLRELDVSWCFQVTNQSLQHFLNLSSNLQSIRIKGCAKITEKTIAALMEQGVIVNCFF